jgi:SOS-response transcriptional repressor LexA
MASAIRRAPRELGYRGCQVLSMVRQRLETHGIAPSYDEIVEELSFCDRAAVSRVVAVLEKRALLRRVGSGRVRRLRLIINNN